jgi:hypothetical protein
MLLLRSDDNTVYLINCVDKGSFLQVGFIYAEAQSTDHITVSDDSNTFKLSLPESLKNVTGYATGVNFKFNYHGN